MNIIKLILAILGAVFLGLIVFSLLGWIGWLLGWVFWIALLGGVGYVGYKLFKKVEAKALGSDPHSGLGTGDIQMSWDEYDRKYLHK